MKKLLFSTVCALLLFASCNPNDPAPPVNPVDVQAMGTANQTFGLDLFRQVVERHPNENVLISPWSVQVAFMMAANGAEGATLSQMLNAMHLNNQYPDSLNRVQQMLTVLMEQQSGHPTLKSANAFFYDENRIAVRDSFLSTIAQWYDATAVKDNFNDPSAKDRINQWVKEKTENKIDGIVDQIKPLDLAFLINALYFKSDWSRGMPAQMVANRDFKTATGSTVNVPFAMDDNDYNFSTLNGFQMTDVPFKDSTYTMSFVMPENAQLNSSWVSGLSTDVIQGLYETLHRGRLMFGFPKLDMEFKTSLIPDLQALGMTDAFVPSAADFSSLGQPLIGPTLYIESVLHKAVLKVDEKGAEGAAVTSIGFGTTSMPPTMVFNRPFVVLLRHRATNTLLFTAFVGQP